MLDEDGKPRLADFGQARLTTESASSLGTLFFMAPEQADLKRRSSGQVGRLCLWEQYLYCMLVGRPPVPERSIWRSKLESSESCRRTSREISQVFAISTVANRASQDTVVSIVH